jgi:uncharacterized protein with PIN domain
MGHMITISLRFYEELNDFLSPECRKVSFQKALPRPTSVKDLIESCGVPHTEVDLILTNNEPVTFDYVVSDNDAISVYPVFESLNIAGVTRLQKRPLRHLRFVADNNLRKLVRLMRLLGFDVTYDMHYSHEAILQEMMNENRVILTTSRHLLMRRIVTRGYCVRSVSPKCQILEVIRRFDLVDCIDPLSRCVACNGTVVSVSKEEIASHLLPKTKQYFHEFTRCKGCEKIYWKGSHTADLGAFIDWIRTKVKKKDP